MTITMSNTKRPYTGFDKIAKEALPGTLAFTDLMKRRWGFSNLGILSVRVMRSAPKEYQKMSIQQLASTPGAKKWMSIHATGRGVDLGWKNRATALEAWNWLLDNATELGIEEVHDYFHKPKKLAKRWGRGYRCSRADKNEGVVEWDPKNNGGTPGGQWLHVELSPSMASDADRLTVAWKSLPKPETITRT